MNLGQFLSLPMAAGSQDRARGGFQFDEAGNPVNQTVMGDIYAIKPEATAEAKRRKAVNDAMLAAAQSGKPFDPALSLARQDGPSMGDLLKGVAEGAWQGVSAPGRALAGETLTMGDVAATALDWGAMGAVGTAPKGAVRVGAMRSADELEGAVREIYPDVDLSIGGSPSRGYTVGKVIVPEGQRNQGVGSGVMREILESADATKSTVALTPSKDFGGSVPRLREFYERHGFVPNKGRNRDFAVSDDMYRVPQEQQPSGITAYHGSPHDFDRFQMDKIGTGEGAQAYGHGLYFAENEGVARSYRDALSGRDPTTLHSALYNMDDVPTNVKDQAFDYTFDPDSTRLMNYLDRAAPDAAERLRARESGSVYEVRLNADPDDFLDYDAPLEAQSQRVRDSLARSDPDMYSPDGNDYDPMDMGSAIYQREVSRNARSGSSLSPERLTSEFMGADGIPGIKYKDAGSRGMDGAEGTRNYVVFDESIIDIVRKYGIAGAAAMLGISEAQLEDQMGQGPLGNYLEQ